MPKISEIRLRDIERKIMSEEDYKLTQEEKEYLVKKAKEYWDDHPDVKARFPRFKKILAWVAGYQYVDYNRESKTIQPVKLQRTRKLVFNRLKPYVRTVLGKMTSVPPQTGVVPKTNEYEDEAAARVGDLVIEALSAPEKINIANVRKLFYLWVILLNRAALRVYWNEDAEGLKGYEQEEEKDEEGNIIGSKFSEVTEPGDIAIEAVSPFNCRSDPLFFDHDKWRWFIYADYADAEALEEEYELEPGSLGSERDEHLDDAYSLTQTGDVEFNQGQSSEEEDISGRKVIRLEYWTPGMYAIIAGKKLLKYGKNPYKEIPYFVFEERLVPVDNYEKGIIFNDSLIKDLIPVQREYNRFMSLMSLGIERMTKVKVMAPFDSLVNKKQVYDDGGLVIVDYNRNMGEPHQLKLDSLPPFILQYKQELERELESGGNVHEASFGRLPERASHASGALVNLLVEQDDITFDPITREVDAVFSRAWTLALRIVQDNYVTKRLLRVIGRDSVDSVVYFEGADLKGNTDVQVTPQVGLPRSRPLRVQWIMNMRQAGLIPDDKMALELMEFGQAKRVYEDVLLHEHRARRENLQIEQAQDLNNVAPPTPQMQMPGMPQPGMPQQPQPPSPAQQMAQSMIYDGDDDTVHLKFHERDRLSAKYEKYSEGQKECLTAHIALHKQRQQQAQQAQMQQVVQQTMMLEQAKATAKAQAKVQAQAAVAGQPGGEGIPPGSIPNEQGTPAPGEGQPPVL